MRKLVVQPTDLLLWGSAVAVVDPPGPDVECVSSYKKSSKLGQEAGMRSKLFWAGVLVCLASACYAN